jgi:glycosyltransferase involved in cell wall biosynthesis
MNKSRPAAGKKILFLSHEATRTGAPLFLLHVLRWLRENRADELEVFLSQGGELEGDFASVAHTQNLGNAFNWNLREKIHSLFFLHLTRKERWLKKFRRRVKRLKPDLIYANTVATTAEVEACGGLGIPIIWNIHELPFQIGEWSTVQEFDRARGVVDHFVVPSNVAKTGLIETRSVPPEKVTVVNGFVRSEDHARQDRAACRAALRRELGLPEDAFIAGGCGRMSWYKSVDWFLITANNLKVEFPGQTIHLVWLGAAESDQQMRQVSFDLRQAGLQSRVHFLGARAQTAPVFAGLDAFFVSSRQDSVPLVMLEAGFHGLPIICFDRSGGSPEFVGSDAGVVCGFGDTRAAARALVQLKEQPEVRERMGATARSKVLAQYQLEHQAPKIGALIDRVCEAVSRPRNNPRA